ncbi:MAG: TVP38/TMEM64 family protein [Nitrospirales bacterium]
MRSRPTAKQWLKVTALVLLLAGAYVAVQVLDLRLLLDPERVAAWLDRLGLLAPLVFMAVMATAVVVSPIPSLPLDLAGGATFGILPGTLYAVIGAEVGAIVSFLIGRALGREVLTRLLRVNLAFCERCSDHHLWLFVFLSRLLPIFSFDVISYGAGLTNMSLKAFALATLLGMIPPTFALTAFGGSVVHGTWPWVILGAVLVILFLLLPKLMVRYRDAAWVRLLRGGAPMPQMGALAPDRTGEGTADVGTHCASCGAPLTGEHRHG